METANLTGPLLDYWVARALNIPVRVIDLSHWPFDDRTTEIFFRREGQYLMTATQGLGSFAEYAPDWQPSESWAIGGPLIERGRIGLACSTDGTWHALIPGERPLCAAGPTPLVAVARAVVTAEFGATVPDEVLP